MLPPGGEPDSRCSLRRFLPGCRGVQGVDGEAVHHAGAPLHEGPQRPGPALQEPVPVRRMEPQPDPHRRLRPQGQLLCRQFFFKFFFAVVLLVFAGLFVDRVFVCLFVVVIVGGGLFCLFVCFVVVGGGGGDGSCCCSLSVYVWVSGCGGEVLYVSFEILLLL